MEYFEKRANRINRNIIKPQSGKEARMVYEKLFR